MHKNLNIHESINLRKCGWVASDRYRGIIPMCQNQLEYSCLLTDKETRLGKD